MSKDANVQNASPAEETPAAASPPVESTSPPPPPGNQYVGEPLDVEVSGIFRRSEDQPDSAKRDPRLVQKVMRGKRRS